MDKRPGNVPPLPAAAVPGGSSRRTGAPRDTPRRAMTGGLPQSPPAASALSGGDGPLNPGGKARTATRPGSAAQLRLNPAPAPADTTGS